MAYSCERLAKDSPVELEVGQSLRFAASTRTYILRINDAALFPPPQPEPTEINLPPLPDPSDEEAVVIYNTFLNRYGLAKPNSDFKSTRLCNLLERSSERFRRTGVGFKDEVGGESAEIVGISDGFDVETEAGPVGVKEGNLVGKYESLVKITVIPKGKEQSSASVSQTGVTEKLQQVLNKVKTPTKNGIYDDLYADLLSGKVGSSWAYSSTGSNGNQISRTVALTAKRENQSSVVNNESDDDLFS